LLLHARLHTVLVISGGASLFRTFVDELWIVNRVWVLKNPEMLLFKIFPKSRV